MVSLGNAGLALAYLGLVALLVSVLGGTRWPRSLKAGLVALVAALYVASLHALPAVLGWAATAALPQRFALVASHVQEPDKASGRPGAIFLWVSDLTDNATAGPPRAYRLAFTTALNAAVAAAGDNLRKGRMQIGEVREGAADSGSLKGAAAPSPVSFFDVPDDSFPEQ